MKLNKFKTLLIAVYCFLFSLPAITMEPYKQSNVYDLPQFQHVRECAEKYAQRHDLSIDPLQCSLLGNSPQKYCTDGFGSYYCPPENVYKIGIKLPFNLDEKTRGWRIAYHQTNFDAAFSIAKHGFDVNRSQFGSKAHGAGTYLVASWIAVTRFAKNFAASKYVINKESGIEILEGKKYAAILQCRIAPNSRVDPPDSFAEHSMTWLWSGPKDDPNPQEIVVQDPQRNIVVYGILFYEIRFDIDLLNLGSYTWQAPGSKLESTGENCIKLTTNSDTGIRAQLTRDFSPEEWERTVRIHFSANVTKGKIQISLLDRITNKFVADKFLNIGLHNDLLEYIVPEPQMFTLLISNANDLYGERSECIFNSLGILLVNIH